MESVPQRTRHPGWLLTGFWICVVIAFAVVLRRVIALAHPSTTSGPMGNLDSAFSSHAALTLAHIIPAAAFVALSIAVLFSHSRPVWLVRSFFLLGVVTGLTAYAMTAYAFGGWIERSAVYLFDTWFLFSLARAYRLREVDPERSRSWTTRGVAVLLGIATTRPVMGVFFATSPLTHLHPTQFFGIAFWLGFSINAAVVELWLHSRRRAAERITNTRPSRHPIPLYTR
jgi:hypothetical protein